MTIVTKSYQQEETERAGRLREAFAEDKGLRRYKNTPHNLRRMLRHAIAAGLGAGAIDPDSDYGFCARSGAFDHGELWGRDGCPTTLVGHPYEIRPEDEAFLDILRAAGLAVYVDDRPSHYGFGTHHVRAELPNVPPQKEAAKP